LIFVLCSHHHHPLRLQYLAIRLNNPFPKSSISTPNIELFNGSKKKGARRNNVLVMRGINRRHRTSQKGEERGGGDKYKIIEDLESNLISISFTSI